METLDVTLPAGAAGLPSEYEALTGGLSTHYQGPLADLREGPERQDITYLASKSRWDARAVAMAALADQFSRNRLPAAGMSAASAGIRPEFYYALFRAGLPANPDSLYQADPQRVAAIWNQAISRGVIADALQPEVTAARQAFEALATAKALGAAPQVGPSTLGELLDVSLGGDVERQQKFADLYVRHRSDPTTLWTKVEEALGPETTGRLRLDGQLAYLTLNNGPLMSALHTAEATEPAHLDPGPGPARLLPGGQVGAVAGGCPGPS